MSRSILRLAYAFCNLLLAVGVGETATTDDVALVQGRFDPASASMLYSQQPVRAAGDGDDGAVLGVVLSADATSVGNTSEANTSDANGSEAPAPHVYAGEPKMYQIWLTENFGDDYTCLTEIEFYDQNDSRMEATYESMSSCYGCHLCHDCKHVFGNPRVQFDGVSDNDSEAAWSCTVPGSFRDGTGLQKVLFSLPDRPSKYVLAKASVEGEWVAKAWRMEEMQEDGSWWVISSVNNATKELRQTAETSLTQPMHPDFDPNNGPAWNYEDKENWMKTYQNCGGFQQSPIILDPKGVRTGISMEDSQRLNLTSAPVEDAFLYNTGFGLQVPGNFGNLTVANATYEAKLFNFHFPAEHRVGEEDLAAGEMHVVFQKQGSSGVDNLAVVSVLLQLPSEASMLTKDEHFFLDLGMENVPQLGSSVLLPRAVDLFNSTLADRFRGPYWYYKGSLTTPPCTEGVLWFVMAKPALVSGSVLVAFKRAFPSPMNNRPIQRLNDRQVFTSWPQPAAVTENETSPS